MNDRLFQITQLKDKTAITRINNSDVEVINKFDEKYNFFLIVINSEIRKIIRNF